MKIYLASPFFNINEILMYEGAIESLRAKGYDVYVPREHTIEGAWQMPNSTWAGYVFDEDVRAINECDVVLVMNHGMYSDSGTAWEAGYAMAAGKRVVQILCGEPNTTYSLMMISSADKVVEYYNVENWEEVSAETSLDKVIQK